MPWNYRVVKHVKKNPLFGRKPQKITPDADWEPEPFSEFVTWYGIHECYYNESDRGKPDAVPHSMSVDPITLSAENIEELRDQLDSVWNAFAKPTLDCDMKFAKREDDRADENRPEETQGRGDGDVTTGAPDQGRDA